MNSATASYCDSAEVGQLRRVGQPERRDRDTLFGRPRAAPRGWSPGASLRLPRRAAPPAAARRRAPARGCRSPAAGPYRARYAVELLPCAVSLTPSVCAICGSDELRVGDRCQRQRRTRRAGSRSTSSAADLQREPGLARAAGPGERDAAGRRSRRSSVTTSASSRSRPTSGVDCTGRFVGGSRACAAAGSVAADPRAIELEQALRLASGPSAGARRDPRTRTPSSSSASSSCVACGDQHLPAVPGRADPRATMDADADVALGGRGRLGRVDAHPHAQLAPSGHGWPARARCASPAAADGVARPRRRRRRRRRPACRSRGRRASAKASRSSRR